MNRLTLKNHLNRHRFFKSSRKKQLIYAIENNDIRLVKALLNDGVDINFNYKDYTPLIWPIVHRNTEIVKILLERPDIDVNKPNVSKNRPLLISATLNNIETTKLLLARDDIDVNAKSDEGFTALINATTNNNTEIIKLLLARDDIDVNAKSDEGYNSLINATAKNNTEIIKLLLAKGDIDVNAKGVQGFTALINASANNNTEIIKLLLTRDDIDVNAKNYKGFTALINATNNNNTKVVELLLAKSDIDVNAKLDNGITALINATFKNNTEIIKLLLAKGDIDVNAKGVQGFNALINASANNNIEIIKLLLTRDDIDVNAKSDKGFTALINATFENNTVIAILLLTRDDIDVNAKNDKGFTALINATTNNNTKVVELLLAKGDIDVNAKGFEGFTALINATGKNNNTEIVELLLAKSDIDVNAKSDDGTTALINAAGNNNTEIAELLLAKGDIDVNAETDKGFTALINAVGKNNTEIIRLLINKNAKLHGTRELKLYKGDKQDILEYLQSGKKSVKWEGVSRNFIQLFDEIFDITPDKDGKIPAANISTCPICLSYANRTDGCMYMSHDCKLITPYYHKELYDKYSYIPYNGKKEVQWCTVCGRITDDHKHFNLLRTTDPKPNPNSLEKFNIYGNDCIGRGGGGLPEKLNRISTYRIILLSLQDQIGKITKFEAYKLIIEAVWNAPLDYDNPNTNNKPEGWNSVTKTFPVNKAPKVDAEAPNIPPPSYLVAPTYIENGINDTFQEEGPAIIFFHKQEDGSVKTHIQSVGEFVDFISAINPYKPTFGKCMYSPACNSCLHPEEVRIISEVLGKLDHALYEKYKKNFNEYFNGKVSPCHENTAGGGEDDGLFELIEAKDAVCLSPPPRNLKNTRRNRRFRKTRSKKRA